ncbi:MAG: membrane lipoprotein lipid attachment site-containing protein [Oscillospiraceae bacterium]|nr:membrane lipoprotein lipid attachment site-containing protein [Oscillospiraceae bacterium]
MKKSIFAICIAALMLTGCGNTATSGGSTADVSSKADTASSAVSDNESKDDIKKSDAHEDEELIYEETVNSETKYIDVPIPKRMKNGGIGISYYATHGFDHRDYHDVEDVVFYMWGEDDPSSWSGVESYKELSAEDLINYTIKNTTKKVLNNAYGEWLTDDYPADTIDTEEEKEMLGYKVKRYSGNISFRGEEKKVHYILNYAFVDNEQVLWWMSFTRSDAQSELDEMQYLADLPLNKAKFHE